MQCGDLKFNRNLTDQKRGISSQYLQKLKHQFKFRYHNFLVSGQVNPNFNFCQIISVYRQLKAVYTDCFF